MSVVYHSYNASNAAVNELVAGAYAEHTGTLGFDENLSTTSRNAVENKAITQRILQDEADYLTKADASNTYKTKIDAEADYAVEYTNTTPSTIKDKIYSVNGNFYAGDATNSTLHELGKVKTVNSQSPDSNGNVTVDTGVMTVNGVSPTNGDIVAVTTVNNTAPDANGNVNVQAGVTSVNGQTGAVTINVGSAITASVSGSTLTLTW